MPLDSLSRYLGEIEKTVRALERAYVERYEEEVLARDRANLRIRIRFQNGHMLEISEAVIVESGRINVSAIAIIFRMIRTNLSFIMITRRIFQGLKNFHITSISLRELSGLKPPRWLTLSRRL